MTFSIILVGVLIILSIFNVGENTVRRLNISKKNLIILLLLTLVLYFVPNVRIFGITFTYVGFALPIIFTTIILLGTKHLNNFLRIAICVLLTFCLSIVYDLITFDVYEESIFQPYIALGIILGILPLFIVKEPKKIYAANTIGLLLSEMFFYISKYAIYGDYYMTFGSEKVFACLLISFVSSVILYGATRRIKAIIVTKRLLRKEKEIQINV